MSDWNGFGPEWDDAPTDLEVKVRHVRTPEGARAFHKPIGAEINSHGVDVRNIAPGDVIHARGHKYTVAGAHIYRPGGTVLVHGNKSPWTANGGLGKRNWNRRGEQIHADEITKHHKAGKLFAEKRKETDVEAARRLGQDPAWAPGEPRKLPRGVSYSDGARYADQPGGPNGTVGPHPLTPSEREDRNRRSSNPLRRARQERVDKQRASESYTRQLDRIATMNAQPGRRKKATLGPNPLATSTIEDHPHWDAVKTPELDNPGHDNSPLYRSLEKGGAHQVYIPSPDGKSGEWYPVSSVRNGYVHYTDNGTAKTWPVHSVRWRKVQS